MEGLLEIKQLLSMPKNIGIIAHRNPDGDALGSSLALRFFLEKQGHLCRVVMPSESPRVFNYLKGIKDIHVFDLAEDNARDVLKSSDVIFCLDFNGLDRVDKLADSITTSGATIIMIDHHIDPEPFADYYLSETTASSTCELVYKFIELLGQKDKIDVSIGEALFTGIITDTGSFKYATNPNVYRIAGELKALGIDDYKLNDLIFNCLTEKQLRLLGHALVNRMEVMSEYQTGIIALNKYDYEKYTIGRGDTEGIVNYILMMNNIKVAILLKQQPSIIKLSFRSKGDISVQEIARNHFKGGGHKNASGGSAYGNLPTIIEKIKEVIPQYIQKIEI